MEVLMATTNTKPEPKTRTFGENIESDLASRFLRVVETAAIASARTMGKGERHFSDQVATEAMHKNIARRLDRDVEDFVVIVLDRPRNEKLMAEIRAAGARIRLISDGDLSAGIAAAVLGTGVHAVMGSGGAPEGVITAAAIRCLNGYMLG